MASSKLPKPLDGLLHTLEHEATNLQRFFQSLPGTLHHTHAIPAKHKPKAKKVAKAKAAVIPAGEKPGLTEEDFKAAADALGSGISVALVHAFAQVESGGKSGFGPQGLPVIAFEGHVFRKYTHHQYDQDHPLLSYKYVKKAGAEWKTNNKDQATAWKTLEEALTLDHDAALLACSWGMFQVMGFNFEMCGYKSVDGFVAAMKASERSQLLAFVAFCKKTKGCVKAMKDKDFAGMAKAYNGKDYGDYDKRIEKAYKKFGGK